ncbi:signal recognition particle 9 kDa protein (SRP9) domain-containing protein [Hirsutella rhossiliensis]|uniref:Signal recognition particle 9 kDa protein (SRP9) domain-containing protein n=1 Tax=Hirsutella rhossiliensis TaxID=111463 RepID=A0A9P8MWP3_9HYPO|nr:signal recognition particle 9 kDa protein (SRP9) domain-containing protein [Hirsutella rhossiliensis]KAH0960552.1 signal recognition particle 9 kDa protein (SRP9) domain-containing protein [Hirsutella rhossiliensis]
MPYFKSSQEWVEQSVLLLEARPSTTRITTRYSIGTARPGARKLQEGDAAASTDTDVAAAKPPRGSLVLKTYDPVSGVTLKYRTAKAAEVSRLVYSALGRLGRVMAAVPAEDIDEPMLDAPASTDVAAKDRPESAAAAQAPQQGGTAKRKRKGRK